MARLNPVVTLQTLPLVDHPPYKDPGLRGKLGRVFRSADGCFSAALWQAWGPGRLLETPKADELICLLKGKAAVVRDGRTTVAVPGDVILWLRDDPPSVFIEDHLEAFCVSYKEPTR